MSRFTLLASAAFIAIATSAHAQVTQVQLDDSFATMNIEVSEASNVSGAAIAGGNAYTSVIEDETLETTSDQHTEGGAQSTTNVTAWHVEGNLVASSITTGNGMTAEVSNSDLRVAAAQTAHGDMSATTNVRNENAWAAASSSAAAANVTAVDAENSTVSAELRQESTGPVSATTNAEHCCVSTQVVADAVASANNASLGGYTATVLTDTHQTSTGERVEANVNLYAGYAYDAVGNATANGNALNVNNEWGYANVRATQENTSAVEAISYVTLGGDWLGFASASAYGVGNSTVVSNVGSDTVLDVTQTNEGAIGAHAALSGIGGDALASSAAYGNVITGGLCGGPCESDQPTLRASSTQTNAGTVQASTTIVAPRANTVAGSASAIGNAATYQSLGGGGP